MLKNYLKIALRTLRRQKGYAAINVGSLALGIACCVLLLLYVRDEVAHDRFHEKAGRIVRVNHVAEEQGATRRQAGTPVQLGPALAAEVPEVERAVRLAGKALPVARGEETAELDLLFADDGFFDVFSFPLRAGNPASALEAPDGIVLSASAAERFFPDSANPIGQTLTVELNSDATRELRVTGVAAPVPHASSIQFDAVLPFEAYRATFDGRLRDLAFERWDFHMAATFALLGEGADRAAAEQKASALLARRSGEGPQTVKNESGEDVEVVGKESGGARLALQPLAAIHLDPSVQPSVLRAPGRPAYSYLLGAAALLVLLLACVNFTTLAVGRSADRAREVGVRKALGAQRAQVAGQFWGEALLTTGFALVLGVALARAFLPVFNPLAGKDLSMSLFAQPWLLGAFAALAVLVALLAGSYPALVLSGFEPTRVLRAGSGGGPGGHGWLVRGLVAMQFALSIALATGAVVVQQQVQRLKTDLGFQQEQVVQISPSMSTEEGGARFAPFREEALRHAAVQDVAGAAWSFFGSSIDAPLVLGDTGRVTVRVMPVTAGFTETLGIETLAATPSAGSEASRTDGASDDVASQDAPPEVTVNRELVRRLGLLPEEALGRELTLGEEAFIARAFPKVRIARVVEDFHTRDLKHRLDPVILVPAARFGGPGVFYARLAPGRLADGLDHLQATWAQVAPDWPFAYEFLDDVVAEAYEAEERWRAIAGYAAGFAVVIACAGILGLAALAARRRTKEIGIRKVLGASAASIVALLSKDFLKLVAVGFALGAPLAYLGARRWLEGFAYRIDLSPWLFLAAGLAVTAAVLVAAGGQAYRAAQANPTEALRSE